MGVFAQNLARKVNGAGALKNADSTRIGNSWEMSISGLSITIFFVRKLEIYLSNQEALPVLLQNCENYTVRADFCT